MRRKYLTPEDVVPGTSYIEKGGKEWLYLGRFITQPCIQGIQDPLPPVEHLPEEPGLYHYMIIDRTTENMISDCESLPELIDMLIKTYTVSFHTWVQKDIFSLRMTPKQFVSESQKMLDPDIGYDRIVDAGMREVRYAGIIKPGRVLEMVMTGKAFEGGK